MDSHSFLGSLALVLGVAAVTTVLFQRLHQPVVLGYLLAGLIIGPHVPVPLVGDPEVVQTLSELGVILLMFSLGLEFRLRKLVELAPTAGLTAAIQSSLMIWIGFVIGRALGWTGLESFFAGAVIAISSTTIIAKAFEEQGTRGRLREFVVGVLIVEDLIAILLMATLTAVATGSGLSARDLLIVTGRLAAFLVGLIGIGMLVVPRFVRSIVALRQETTLVATIGICFAAALLALRLGYSVALGAFIAGSLVAESGRDKHIEHLVEPVRDLFAAIFFVSVGMLIDPKIVLQHWLPIVLLTLAVYLGKFIGVSAGAFLSGQGVRTSVQAAMSLAQIGEFSFIIAGLGLSLGATREFLFPVAVSVSAITTLTTPWLIRASGPIASFVDHKLPRRLATFAALYGSWVERLHSAQGRRTGGSAVRRLVGLLVLDVALLAGVALVASARESITGGSSASAAIVLGAALLLAIPLALGIVRVARRLGVTLAAIALPEAEPGTLDLADAPRRALVVTLQVAVLLPVLLPLLAFTQPFLAGPQIAVLLAVLLAVLAAGFWRSATNLQGHVRAGARMIADALAAQARRGSTPDEGALAPMRAFLPGLGEPTLLRVPEGSPAAGRTLAELDVRGRTGATVLAIVRGEESVAVPAAAEVLQAGDCVTLAGTHEAVEAAKALLASDPASRWERGS
ncbi:MAG: cation:proton antiporter domain-containing protein [Candidatus Eiseniibacteriota bacterium]